MVSWKVLGIDVVMMPQKGFDSWKLEVGRWKLELGYLLKFFNLLEFNQLPCCPEGAKYTSGGCSPPFKKKKVVSPARA